MKVNHSAKKLPSSSLDLPKDTDSSWGDHKKLVLQSAYKVSFTAVWEFSQPPPTSNKICQYSRSATNVLATGEDQDKIKLTSKNKQTPNKTFPPGRMLSPRKEVNIHILTMLIVEGLRS